MDHLAKDRRPIRVLQSFGVPRSTTNPYLVQLLDALPAHVQVVPFAWRSALLGRYDVVHLHWPELLVRGSDRRRTFARSVLASVLLLRWWALRTPVTRTLHNSSPHEGRGRFEQMFLRAVDHLTTQRVALNDGDGQRRNTTVVLHGHYRSWYAPHARSAPVPGRLAFVGLVRPYKNVPRLLTAFAALADPDAGLVVAGAVRDEALRSEILTAAGRDPRVETSLAHQSDADLVRVVTEAAVVVLPYAEMGNSGVALLALSLDRPILVPRTPAMVALDRETGPGWVRFFDGEIDDSDLAAALSAGLPSEGTADLSARDWPDAGRAHADVYARSLSRR